MKGLFYKSCGVVRLATTVAASAALSAALCACGDDGASADNTEREVHNSSSVEDSSSSAEEIESSSSEEEISDVPEIVTLDSLKKNYSLGILYGSEVFLATGNHKGVFSLWVPDTAWVGFRSEFENGVLKFGTADKNGGWAGANLPVADSLNALVENGAKIQITYDENGELQYSLNGAEPKKMTPVNVGISNNVIYDGSKLNGVAIACKNGEKTISYSFFDGRYVMDSGEMWESGYYDIHRSRLLLLPTIYNAAYPMTSWTVNADFSLTDVSNKTLDCTKSDLDYSEIDHDKIANLWVGEKDGYDWSLLLDKSGTYKLSAKKGNVSETSYTGGWDVYGNVLLMTGYKGVVSGFDAEKGFKWDHNNTGSPALPTEWSVPQYE